MQQKSPDEFDCTQGHDALPIPVSIVLPPECHLSILHGKQPLIGNRHSVRIASKILQNLFGAAERRPGKHHPILFDNLIEQPFESIRLSQSRQVAVKC